jgi:ABC-type sugar transport system substrate-binding protein
MSTPLDLDAIRSRANAADASWLPRWVPHDVRALLSEVAHLRGVVKTHAAQAEQHTAQHVDAIIAQQRLTVEARDAVRALEAENAMLRAQVSELRAWHADAAPLIIALTINVQRIIAWLLTDAARNPPGPVSPIRRVEQAYALRVAGIIERGEHHRGENP